jgi:hypothetical protein
VRRASLAVKLWNEGLNEVFNADLVEAYNILITPSPERR